MKDFHILLQAQLQWPAFITLQNIPEMAHRWEHSQCAQRQLIRASGATDMTRTIPMFTIWANSLSTLDLCTQTLSQLLSEIVTPIARVRLPLHFSNESELAR